MKERIDELAAQLIALREAYYEGAPKVADAEYDALEDELRGLLAEHPELAPDPNPLEQVGAPGVLHAPVRHSRPMLSLEKATKPEQVEAFFARFPGQSVVVMPKLDGLSLAVVYEDGRLARAVTRGDGTTGDDVTMLVRALVDGVPAVGVVGGARGGARRGRDAAVHVRRLQRGASGQAADQPAQRRGGDDPREGPGDGRPSGALHFFAFDLDASEGAAADLEEGLRALGFDPAGMRHCDDAAAAQEVISAIEAERGELDYDLDGAVLRLADRDAFAAAGTRSSSPRGALAFKFAAEEKTTVLERRRLGRRQDREDRAGRVAGARVRRRDHRHASHVGQPGGHPGARDQDRRHRAGPARRRRHPVRRGRAGRVQAHGRGAGHRPAVGVSLVRGAADRARRLARAVLHQPGCPAQTVRRLIHWASRAAADIEAVGPVWIERLAASGDLEHPSDFYALTRERLLEFDRIGEVSADRMIESIDASRNVGLRRALIGLAIPMASEGTAARLCRAGFGSLEEVADAGVEKLVAVDDIGPKVAESLTAHLTRVRPEIDAPPRTAASPWTCATRTSRPKSSAGAPLEGKTVVITGSIADPRSGEKVPRPAFQRLCERAGATTASSVSASTDMLITGADVGASKIAKAEKLEVEVVDQSVIWEQLIAAGVA